MDGIIVIKKEKGFTSHDVVAKLRGILHMKKIGHTGTLDPDAEGVLPVAIGKGTRLVELLTEKTKTYETILHLGITTDTQDISGKVLAENKVDLSEEVIVRTIESFIGEQLQIPPMYSALKVNGKKLCDLAREGITVERKARPVVFYNIEILDMNVPFVRMSVSCSKGTYIRTLCHDIGCKLGCGGCMEQLTRTQSGKYKLEDSVTLSQVENAMKNETINELIIPVEEVLAEFPEVYATEYGDRLLLNGNSLNEQLVFHQNKSGWVRMHKSSGEFVAIYQWDNKKMQYCPVKMFL